MSRKWIGYYLLPSLLLSLCGAYADDPSWYADNPLSKSVLLKESSLPSGGYLGSGIYLKIGPAYLTPKASQMQVHILPGTTLEEVTLDVSSGAVLTLRNCTLRKVAFKGMVGSSINLQGCVLDDCYMTTYQGRYRKADGTEYTRAEMYKITGGPKLNMTDCVVARSTVSSAYLCGLAANRCSFLSCVIDAVPEDGNQASPGYVQCEFNTSKISSTYALVTTSQCRFLECECPDLRAADAGASLLKPMLVQLAWDKCSPPLPTKTANGKVSFELITKAIEAGSPMSYQWNGSLLKVADLPVSTSFQALQSIWKIGNFETYLANNQTTEQPGQAGSMGTPFGNAPITGTIAAAGVVFKSRISQVNGLLISQLSSGGEAGQVTRMSLTALPSLGDAASTLKFNQDVGESMGKALNEVSKFSQLRHGGWPAGHAMEIGFEDKYIGKDGPSAAVACALLLETAITGKKWDPAFAVTGDMNADGSVQPIGGVQAKIRGATKGSCKIVGVPVKNEKAVQDILVLEGPAPLVGITVFGIKTFDDAMMLASEERPTALQNALTDFDNMRAVMMRDPRQIMPLLRTPHAAQRLQALLAAAPNCYSAKYLLLYAQGRMPRVLSIGGSIEAAQNSAASVVSAIEHDVSKNMSSFKGDELGNSLNKLRQLRPTLDARVWPYVDNLIGYGEIIRGSVLNPVRSGARYDDLVGKANKAAGATKAAYAKLINDVEVREELGL